MQQAIALALTAIAPGFPVATLFAPSSTADVPQAISVRASPTTAALYGAPDVTSDHTCTAGVASSITRDLLVTAAHCISGTGSGIKVAPGYDAGSTPYGVWSVTDVFVSSAWQSDHSTSDDIAILRVAPQEIDGESRELQDITGANVLGSTPDSSSTVTVQSFNAGFGDHAISCTIGVGFVGKSPTFRCAGYSTGSSGSPWLETRNDGVTRITGVIGGMNEGGCTDQTSFSPVFDSRVQTLLSRAERPGEKGDDVSTDGPAPACSTDPSAPGD